MSWTILDLISSEPIFEKCPKTYYNDETSIMIDIDRIGYSLEYTISQPMWKVISLCELSKKI